MNAAAVAAARESESSEFFSDEEDSRLEDESKLSEDDLQQTLRSSWKHTLLSLIPFTKEHRALQQVIDAVDNITKLQMEVLRARKLVRTVQAGRHEVALRQLLAGVQQTNFHYFQKVRHERILSGKWLPVVTTVRKRDGPRAPNRFKQAVNSTPKGVDRKKSAWMVQSHAFGTSGKRAGYGSKRKKRLTDDEQLPQCSWQPTPGALQEVGFVCKNSVVRRLDTRRLTSFCAWHSRTCLMAHQDESQAAVAIPNAHGLCSMHHITKFGHDAEPPPLPLPGMVSTLQAYANPYSTHPLAPRCPPPAAVMLNVTSARSNMSAVPAWEQWWRDKLCRTVYAKRRRLAATAIQSAFRMHVCVQRFKAARLLARTNIVRRDKAARSIQRLVRPAQGKAFRVQEYHRRFDASLLLQRWWRGTAARQFLRRNKAAVVIQRLFQLVHARRLRMDDAAMDHVGKYVRQLQTQAVRIQKVWRGYRARKFVARRRIEWVSGVVLIEGAVRKWLVRVRRRRMAARVEARRLARAANILRSFYFQHVRQYKPPPEWTHEQLARVEDIQRVVRGYLSRLAALRLRATRDKLWNFLNPADVEALREILFPTRTAIFQQLLARSDAAEESDFDATSTIQASSAGARAESNILEPFLPDRYKQMGELQTVVFIRALRSLYASWDTPVSEQEISSLVRLFRSESTGQIDVLAFSDYAQLQVVPCRRHARRICGVCIAYATCGEFGCGCQHFKGRFACDDCGHTCMKHRSAPLPNDSNVTSLLGTLAYQATPDVFMTQHALLRPATLRKSARTPPSSAQSPPRRSPRITSRSALSLVQSSMATGTSSPSRKRLQPYLKPITVSLPPDTIVPREEFWSKAKLLPNASVQAYETTIASSMPVGFVRGSELVYTMDASTVYLHILRELQAISEHINADDSKFLRLLLRHATFFERHWRKLARDVRLGTLNNKLVLPEAERQRYLASAVAQPRMANQLDRAFRQLGFHTRMTTKEIPHVTHAELRWPKAKATRTRRHSAPELRAPVATHPNKRKQKRRVSTGSLTGQVLAELTNDQMGERGATALLFQLEGGQLRAVPIKDDGHWLCPYAGCGARFKLQHTAFLHQAMHNWKRALQVANPHADQFLTTFWPTDTPWQQHSTLKRFPCSVCKRVFKSPQRVTAHRRMEHSKRPATFSRQSTKWQWIGSSVLCPPFTPPTCAPLVICTIHRRSRFRCATCVLSNRRIGLQPPLRYYQQIQMRLPPEGTEDHHREFCWLSCKDEQGVVVRWPDMEDYFSTDVNDESRSKCGMSPRHCRLLALCEDRDGQAWMAVLALHNPGFTFNPMQAKVDRHCELQSGTEVRYLPVTLALSYFHLVECDVHTFHEKIREGSIPAHNARYLVPRQPQALSPKAQAASQKQLKL